MARKKVKDGITVKVVINEHLKPELKAWIKERNILVKAKKKEIK